MTASRQDLGRGRKRSWTNREKAKAARRLRRIYRFSPYIIALLLPGGLALLPLIAWWRHRLGARRESAHRR